MQARRSEINITYEGKDITNDILPFLIGLTYTDNASGAADTLDLELMDKDGLWIDSWFPKTGDIIKAQISVINWNFEGDNRSFDCGTFIVDEINFSGRPRTLSLSAISIPAAQDFNDTKKSKTWKKITIKNIANEIANNANVQLMFLAEDMKIDSIEQENTSNMEFLYKLCETYVMAMKVYNEKIVIFDEIDYESKESIGILTELSFTDWSGKTTIAGVYDGVIINYQSPKSSKNKLQYKFKVRDGNRILTLNQQAENLKDAQKQAKAELRKANKEETTLSLNLKGAIHITAGCCVTIEGLGHFNGKYYVDKAVHNINSGFTTNLELHKVLEGGY